MRLTLDPMESGIMSPLRPLRLPTRGAGCLPEFGCMWDIVQVVNVGKDWSQSDNWMCRVLVEARSEYFPFVEEDALGLIPVH